MNFVCHLFFWHYADGGATAGMGISPVLWTLTLEVHFYILYVVCFPWLRRWGVGRLAVVWLLADLAYHVVYVVWLVDLGWGDFWAPSRFSPLRFGEWLVGAYLAERYTQGRPSWKYALPVGIGLLVAAIFAGTLLSLDRYTATNIPATVSFFLILQHYVGNEKHGLARGRFSILRLLGSVGAFSYSLYLFHAVVIPVIRRIFVAFSGGFTRYSVFLVAVACSIGAAYVVYVIIEKPSHELGRKMAARFRPRLKGRDGV
jgi:peptidoglycan/LPS O-acetylase OafA/YrhL